MFPLWSSCMDDMVDEKMSFLEQICDQMRQKIERFSTPRDRQAQAHDSGIATMNVVIWDHYNDPDNTVALQANEIRMLWILMITQAMLQCAGQICTIKIISMGLCLQTHWVAHTCIRHRNRKRTTICGSADYDIDASAIRAKRCECNEVKLHQLHTNSWSTNWQ